MTAVKTKCRIKKGLDTDFAKKKKWELIRDADPEEGDFVPDFLPILQGKEESLSGIALIERADELGCPAPAIAAWRRFKEIPE